MRNSRRGASIADRRGARPSSARGRRIETSAGPIPAKPEKSIAPDELVRGCLRREERAWRLFLERYGRLITTVILRSGASISDAEEIYQNTVQAIFVGLDRLHDSNRIVSWIAGIARRQTYFFLRSRSRQAVDPLEEVPEPIDPAPLSEEEMESLQRSQMVLEALATLRARCRDLLTALYLDDAEPSYKSIEKTLGVPFGSIGPTRARCLDALREALLARGYREGEPGWR